LLFAGCAKTEKPSLKEILLDFKRQDEVINYIVNDYPLMMKFLDKSMANDQAKSMMMGHMKMMRMMMCNTGMMTEIMKGDSTMCTDIMQNMITTACNDSSMCRRMAGMMMNDDRMKGMMQCKMMNGDKMDNENGMNVNQHKSHHNK
jgi:hypothetical protein